MRSIAYISICLSVFLVSSISAQVSVGEDFESAYIEPSMKILPMSSDADWEDELILRGEYDSRFESFKESYVKGKETFNWFQFDLANTTDNSQRLFVGTTRFERITMWVKSDSVLTEPKISGQSLELDDKPVRAQGFSFFEINLEAGQEVTVYFKAENRNAPITPQQVIPMILTSENHFMNNYQRPPDFSYVFMGAMGIMFLFNILLFSTTQLRVYFFYSAYVLAAGMFALGLIPQIALPVYGTMDINQAPLSTAGTIAALFYVLVAIEIMELEKYYPRVNKLLKVLVAFYVIPIITGNFESLAVPTSIFNFLIAFIAFPSIFVLSVLMVFKGHTPSKYFFAAISIFTVGVMSVVLAFTNVIPQVIFGMSVVNWYHGSLIIELALFSLGIAARINEMSDLRIREEMERKSLEEMTELNEEIRTQRDQIQAQKELKDRFFSIISHDLRGPVAAFQGISLIIRSFIKNKNFKDIEDLTEDIDHSSNQLAQLLDNLLNWASQEQGQIPYNPEPVVVKEVFKEIEETLRLRLIAKRIEFHADIDDSVIWADRPTSQVIFRNLLGNAIKFTKERGAITATSHREGDIVRIAITDTGIGIPPDKLNTLFQMTEAKSTFGTMGEKGVGLGLLLVGEFCALNNGKIAVDSTVGKGTTFTVALPAFQGLLKGKESVKQDL